MVSWSPSVSVSAEELTAEDFEPPSSRWNRKKFAQPVMTRVRAYAIQTEHTRLSAPLIGIEAAYEAP